MSNTCKANETLEYQIPRKRESPGVMSNVTRLELDGFLAFWELWRDHMRKSDGRGKARPAYQQMLEMGANPQDIIDGAAWYLRNMSDKDAPYIPLASSWLRSERWADDCEKERALKGSLSQPSTVVQIRTARPRWLEEYEQKQGQA